MVEVVRPDLFKPEECSIAPGYYLLRKDTTPEKSMFLDHLVVCKNKRDEKGLLHRSNVIVDTALYESIADGDVGLVTNRGAVRVVLTRKTVHNTLLVTERCDNLCAFCSQPPKDRDDDWLLAQAAMAIAAFDSNREIGISGGEPLLYRDSFLRFLDFVIEHSPSTPLHILSNGRAFADSYFTQQIAKRCSKHTINFGIPLYSSISREHDHLVGCEGAFNDTMTGIINAGNSGIPIEIRFIPTKHNIHSMGSVIELVARCFSSISQVSIMNLEPAGWARKNWRELYVSPELYADELVRAVTAANSACLPIVLFNYPLCHLSTELREYSVKSISDWKNYYPSACNRCKAIGKCCGYFSSSKGHFHQEPMRLV